MISRARLRANRANAQKSTGPKTARGKRRSSQNAVQHGLRAKTFKPQPTDQERQAFIQACLGSDPDLLALEAIQHVLEAQAALKIVNQKWDQAMASAQEQPEDGTVDHNKQAREITRLSLYARRISALQRKAIKSYNELANA